MQKLFNPLVDVDVDSNPFELYESVPGWLEATKDILAIINIARKEYVGGKDAEEAYKEVRKVLRKYSAWGAQDSEPEEMAAEYFCRGFDLETFEFC